MRRVSGPRRTGTLESIDSGAFERPGRLREEMREMNKVKGLSQEAVRRVSKVAKPTALEDQELAMSFAGVTTGKISGFDACSHVGYTASA